MRRPLWLLQTHMILWFYVGEVHFASSVLWYLVLYWRFPAAATYAADGTVSLRVIHLQDDVGHHVITQKTTIYVGRYQSCTN